MNRLLLPFTFAAALAVSVTSTHAATDTAAPITNTPAPRFQLGAGDRLGRAVFSRFTQVVRARRAQSTQLALAKHRPAVVAADPSQKWMIVLVAGQRVIKLDGSGNPVKPVLSIDPPPNSTQPIPARPLIASAL